MWTPHSILKSFLKSSTHALSGHCTSSTYYLGHLTPLFITHLQNTSVRHRLCSECFGMLSHIVILTTLGWMSRWWIQLLSPLMEKSEGHLPEVMLVSGKTRLEPRQLGCRTCAFGTHALVPCLHPVKIIFI